MHFKSLFALALIGSSSMILAEEVENTGDNYSQIYLLPAIGNSQIDLDASEPSGALGDNFDQTTTQISLGYKFENDLVIEATSANHSDFLVEFFGGNHYEVHETRLSLGYRASAGQFRLVPKLGISSYEFEANEGHFLSLPETRRRLNDNDLVISLLIEYEFSRNFGVFIDWSMLDAEFGSLDVTTIGMRFGFY